ncbi:MAG: cysteine desulfurase [Ignisphaera sp.]|uniref:Cysteine desulfurase n=1 Tax=Ignisphaera aggregans TaxID=334771 RepID=A0A7J3JPD2_9CREN
MFNVMAIREDFPILKKEINGRPLIYFDNAATTHKPNQVIDAIARFYREFNANVHRGMHTLSQEASTLYEDSLDVVAKFINAYSWEEVIEVKNATDGLNIAAWGWGLFNLKPDDEIILTVMDHHSNMLPWRIVAERTGAVIRYVDITEDGDINYDQFEEMVNKRTRVIAITMASNVLGTIVDVKRICKVAHSVGAIVVGDAAQYVPHVPTDVRDLGIDFIAFSGHKMLGPTGIGILWGRRDVLEEMKPFRVGGDTIKDVTLDSIEWHDLPWRFIAGTPHIAGMIGLAEAVRYLMRIGMENVRQHDIELTEHTLKGFRELENEISVLGPLDARKRTGIVSFNVNGLHHHVVAKALDSFGIAVRSGGHCAHPLHYRLGLKGSVRASYYIYNTLDEVDTFISALKFIVTLRDVLSKHGIEDRCTGT